MLGLLCDLHQIHYNLCHLDHSSCHSCSYLTCRVIISTQLSCKICRAQRKYSLHQQVVEAPNLTSLVYVTDDDEPPSSLWTFPFTSATSLKHLRWEGPGLKVPLQALENSRLLTSLDLTVMESSVPSRISLWPSLSGLRSLTLYNYSAPPGAYIAHAFTVFTRYDSSHSPDALIALSLEF